MRANLICKAKVILELISELSKIRGRFVVK